jgi:hypothetical protein
VKALRRQVHNAVWGEDALIAVHHAGKSAAGGGLHSGDAVAVFSAQLLDALFQRLALLVQVGGAVVGVVPAEEQGLQLRGLLPQLKQILPGGELMELGDNIGMIPNPNKNLYDLIDRYQETLK